MTPWTVVARQAPLSTGFSWQEYWSGLPFLSPGDLPDPGIEPRSPALQADSLPSEPPGKPKALKKKKRKTKTNIFLRLSLKKIQKAIKENSKWILRESSENGNSWHTEGNCHVVINSYWNRWVITHTHTHTHTQHKERQGEQTWAVLLNFPALYNACQHFFWLW